MNALIILVLTGALGMVMASSLPNEVREASLGVYVVCLAAVLIRADMLFRKDPRAFCYGPNEHLEESRLGHERHMEAMKRK